MTDAFWTTLIASFLSAVAALSGVALTNSHALRRHQAELQEKLRGQQREIIAEIVLAGRQWASRQEIWVPAVSKMNRNDLMEYAQTDSSKAMGDVLERLNVAFVKADLFIPNGSLKDEITWLAEFVQTFPSKVIGPVMENREDFDHVILGLRAVDMFSRKLLGMSRNASTRLGVQDPATKGKPDRLRQLFKGVPKVSRRGKGV
ncbi:hypothetical protein [Arthrobacter sp. H-02-3]|uniref:hypothetical protein n=1 Tax=Arthrobacter sp. H-02-3 TaxID=2703675 RepID=UPI000DD1A6B9|nr:hypothetical protein [Arthrobacter sp. H-02-3]PVZ53033.1 hypothetical protein C9424_18805 [Arthrobacter sp. H-02-3]